MIQGLALALLAFASVGQALAQQRAPRTPPPAVTREAPPPAPAPRPLERRVTVAELGLPSGLAFGAAGAMLRVPLPRDLPGLAPRLTFGIDLAAPFGGAHAVELRANGRLIESRAFAEGATRIDMAVPIPAEDAARDAAALHLDLALVARDGPSAALATLRADSHVTLSLPAGALPSVASTLSLLPRQVIVLTRPGGMPALEAAAALRAALGLAASGREVRIAAAAAPEVTIAPDGTRLWQTGAVVIGATAAALSVVEAGGAPVLAIGGQDPEGAARLLESEWRQAIGATPAAATIRPGVESRAAVPLADLGARLAPQTAARADWHIPFSLRDLPPPGWPRDVRIELAAPADTPRGVASILFNEELIGTANLPAEGPLRLVLPVPERLVGMDNRLTVQLRRAAAGAPAQLLPDSAIGLGAGPASQFLALPASFAHGLEVLLEAPTGAVPAEALALPLWLLRTLAPPGVPILVTAVPPGTVPRPQGAFLAVTGLPPHGADPPVALDAGRIALRDARGAPLLQIDGASAVLVAQALRTEDRDGLWVRGPAAGPPISLPAAAPRFTRGDIAVIDRQGVALEWRSGPRGSVTLAYPDRVVAPSLVQVWRPYVAIPLWLGGLVLVAYAFARPRRAQRA